MRNFLFFFLLCFFCYYSNAQKKQPFSKLKFDSAAMYDFAGGKGTDLYIINSEGKLAKNIKKKIVLQQQEITELNKRLNNKKSYGEPTASCFDPHLGFVYYNKGKIVAYVTVCLDCNKLVSSITIPEQLQGKTGSGKEVYYTGNGLSKSFKNYLHRLLSKYKFSNHS